MTRKNTLILLILACVGILLSLFVVFSPIASSKLKFHLANQTLSFELDLKDKDKNIQSKLGLEPQSINSLGLKLRESSAKQLAFLDKKEVSLSSNEERLNFVTDTISDLEFRETISNVYDEVKFLPESTFFYFKSFLLSEKTTFGTDLINPNEPLTLVAFGKDQLRFAFLQVSTDIGTLTEKVEQLEDLSVEPSTAQRTEGPAEGVTQTQSRGETTKTISLPDYSLTLTLGVIGDHLVIASDQSAYEEIRQSWEEDKRVIDVGTYQDSIAIGWIDLIKTQQMGLDRIAGQTKNYLRLSYQTEAKEVLNKLLEQKQLRFWIDRTKMIRGVIEYR